MGHLAMWQSFWLAGWLAGWGGREGVVSTAKPGHRLQQQTASERRERQI